MRLIASSGPGILALLVTPALSLLLAPVLPPISRAAAGKSPGDLSYVEASDGLEQPALDGGRLEVELGDIDGDGRVDIASIGDHGSPFINTDEHGIMVWFGDGQGHWRLAQRGDFGYGGLALGDVNNDGLMDVGYGMHHNYSGTDLGDQILEVALGNGSGLFWTPWDDGLATNGESWGMHATDFADVDNDGDLDIGSISFGCCAGVHVYLNNGDGTWTQSFGFTGGNSLMQFVFGDIDADGNCDFAVSHQDGTIFLGDGQGGFVMADGNLPGRGSVGHPGVDLGDVNGDGLADLSMVNTAGGAEVWLAGATGWTELSTGLPQTGSIEATQLADMDADGVEDLVTFGEGQLEVYRGDGGSSFTLAASLATPSPGYHAALRVSADTDHNGRPDIALVAEEGDSWWNRVNHLHVYAEASRPLRLTCRLTRPGPHQSLRSGSIRFIDWVSAVPRLRGAGGAEEVASRADLDLSTTGPTGTWIPVAAALPDNGRYQWRVPQAASADCYLRLTIRVGTRTTTSLIGPFRILP